MKTARVPAGSAGACAAGIATLQLYRDEDLFARAARMAPKFESALHSLKGARHVVDVRNIGLVAGIELASRDGAVGARAAEVFQKCWERGLMVRYTGETIAVSPPLIINEDQINEIFHIIRGVLQDVA